MNEPTVNVPLLRKVLEHITAHPEEWDQSSWVAESSCGTACCVAGWTVLEAGYQLTRTPFDIFGNNIRRFSHVLNKEGEPQRIGEVASGELGLSPLQSEKLFDAMNTLHHLWRWAEEFTDGEIQSPPNLPNR